MMCTEEFGQWWFLSSQCYDKTTLTGAQLFNIINSRRGTIRYRHTFKQAAQFGGNANPLQCWAAMPSPTE